MALERIANPSLGESRVLSSSLSRSASFCYAPVAQWLEQRTHNPLVTGSSPVGRTIDIFGDTFVGVNYVTRFSIRCIWSATEVD